MADDLPRIGHNSHLESFSKHRLLILAVVAFGVVVPSANAQTGRYVALGDSFASGAGVAPYDLAAPPACSRSAINTAHLVASDLGYTNFVDNSCSGATTYELSSPQNLGGGNQNPPQADALNGSETLVTVSLGGNDAQYGNVTTICLPSAYANTTPTATPCRDTFIYGGVDHLAELASSIAGNVKAGLDLIRSRAPFAEIYAIGYLQMIPPDAAGCPGAVGVSVADAQLFDNWWRTINSTIKFQAQVVGAHFVDNYTPSIGHSACSGANRWVEPSIGAVGASTLHPNAKGLRATADAIENAIAVKQGPGESNPVSGPASVVLKLKNARFHAARSGSPIAKKGAGGAQLKLTAAHAGKVAFTFSRVSGKKKQRIGKPLLVKVALGTNHLRVTGRYHGRALKPGRYQLKAQFVEAGAAAPTSLAFRLLR